jgi:hypothetical protein
LHRTDRTVSELGYTYALTGRPDKARGLVKELEQLTKRRYVSPVNIARIYAGLGQQELVFRWLQKAYDDRSDHLLALGVDPSFDAARSNPRFADLMRQLGLENE